MSKKGKLSDKKLAESSMGLCAGRVPSRGTHRFVYQVESPVRIFENLLPELPQLSEQEVSELKSLIEDKRGLAEDPIDLRWTRKAPPVHVGVVFSSEHIYLDVYDPIGDPYLVKTQFERLQKKVKPRHMATGALTWQEAMSRYAAATSGPQGRKVEEDDDWNEILETIEVSEGDGMLMNRDAYVVTLKQPFVDWINGKTTMSDRIQITLKEANDQPSVFLLPVGTSGYYEEFPKKAYTHVFEQLLIEWVTDPKLWPEDRSFKNAKKYFSIKPLGGMYDLSKPEVFWDWAAD